MRLHNEAMQAKNDMKTLRKSQQQPRFVQNSQPVQHESDECVELTPMPSPMSSPLWSEENIQRPTLLESKKCSHCGTLMKSTHFKMTRVYPCSCHFQIN